ncbi:MAG: hypothetical protein IKD69_00575 [Solobacterium sp.]|nr:hypothetical protein [Solobacterium sp.]
MGIFDKLLKEADSLVSSVASKENQEKASAFLAGVRDTIQDTVKEVASEENREKASAFLNHVRDSIQDTVQEATSEENREKAAAFFGNIKDSLSAKTQEHEPKEEMYEYDDTDGRSCREKLLAVLAEDFSQYTVRENVSPHTIGGEGRFMDYSIAVYSGDVPVPLIMIVGKTTTSHREYRWSREEAAKHGYPMINFVEHYPNRPDYIRTRLQKYLPA